MAGFISGNATLSDGSVSTGALADNAITLAKMAGGTDGNLISFDSSGNPVAVATGTLGQVLTSAGPGAPPTMEDASAGAWEFVSTAAVGNVANISITGIASGYDYNIVFESICPTNDLERLSMRVSLDGGSTYKSGASDYSWGTTHGDVTASDTADTEIYLVGAAAGNSQMGNDAGLNDFVDVLLYNPGGTGEDKLINYRSGYQVGDAGINYDVSMGVGCYVAAATAIDAVQFGWKSWGSGTFKAQGDVTVWRRKRS